jgi:anti-sigma factor RsiW
MKKTCEEIADVLIDYADGELSGSMSEEVAEHSKSCAACQLKVKALNRSLELTRTIWQDCEGQIANTWPRFASGHATQHKHWLRYASIAASILLIVSLAIMWKAYIQQPKPTFEQIQNDISQAAVAAQLLAAADIVAGQKGGEQIAKEQYLYISQNYKNTPYAKEALAKIKSN